jgi:hypothetical protein
MISRERIKRIFNLEYYGNPEGAGQCGLSEAIDRASDRILAELEPEKVKVGDRVEIVECRTGAHTGQVGFLLCEYKTEDSDVGLDGGGTCVCASKVRPVPKDKPFDSASSATLGINQGKPKSLLECFQKQYPGIQDGLLCWPKDREAVKAWLASKPKKMTVEQLLDELEEKGTRAE